METVEHGREEETLFKKGIQREINKNSLIKEKLKPANTSKWSVCLFYYGLKNNNNNNKINR